MAINLNASPLALCHIATITKRNGVIVRISDSQEDLVIGGLTYHADPAVSFGDFHETNTPDVPTGNVSVSARSDRIKISDIRHGLYDGAECVVDYADMLQLQKGDAPLISGYLGNAEPDQRGMVNFEVRGLMSAGTTTITKRFMPTCDHDLGDSGCRKVILPADRISSHAYNVGDVMRLRVTNVTTPDAYANRYFECVTAGTSASSQPDYTGSITVSHVTTDGTAAFKTRNALTRWGQIVSSVDDYTLEISLPSGSGPWQTDDTWFPFGVIIFRTGALAGQAFDVLAWDHITGFLVLFDEVASSAAFNDFFEIYPGCNKTPDHCLNRFANMPNFGGVAFAPGLDFTTNSLTNATDILSG